MKCGGVGDAKEADAEIQKLCDEIRADLEGKANKSFAQYTAKSYKSQVVAGTNYFVKIQVDDDGYIHVRIFKSLPHAGGKAELHSYKEDMTAADDIVHF